MKNTNKNSSAGIDSYLTAQKLFQKQKAIPTTASPHKFSHPFPNPDRNMTPHHKKNKPKYQYSLLSDLRKKQTESLPENNSSEFDPNNNIQQQHIEQHHQNLPSPHNPIIYNYNELVAADSFRELEIEAEKSPFPEDSRGINWESMVIKTSRKYFEACRNQAVEYLSKIQSILQSDKKMLNKQIKSIQLFINENYDKQAHKLKEYLYKVVDKSVEDWKQHTMKTINQQQISYMGDLFQLNIQVQERLKQMKEYRIQMEDEKNWKQRASDLLTANYEQDVIQLSNLCKSSADGGNESVKKWMIAQNERFASKLSQIPSNAFHAQIKQSIMMLVCQKNQKECIQEKYMRQVQNRMQNCRKYIFDSTKKQSRNTVNQYSPKCSK